MGSSLAYLILQMSQIIVARGVRSVQLTNGNYRISTLMVICSYNSLNDETISI